MQKPIGKHFSFAPLTKYSWQRRLVIRFAGLAGYLLTALLGKLTRCEVEGWEHLDGILAAGQQPVLVFWHDRILLATYYFRHKSIVVLSSKSFDGEYTARLIQRFGFGAIRGSSSRGGSGAIVEMIKMGRNGYPAGFTVDGPRGPRYKVKTGPVLVAKKTGNPMLPFMVEARRYWALRSWDRLQIPWPFARAKVIIGKPIYVDPKSDDSEMERKLAELQIALDDLVESGRKWREGS
ncbi:lysophospholipid acyltransferase family protein [soil metagenome]